MSESVLVSVLHPDARSKAGKASSAIVVNRSQLTASLITTEGWSPILYKSERRLAVDFEEARVIGFDIDDGMTLAEAVAKFAKFKHVIGTTSSHQRTKGSKPACDRFRLLLFTDAVITTAADYKETLSKLAEFLKIPVDGQAKDAARWFIPCKAIVSERLQDGELVSVYKAASENARTPVVVNESATLRGRLSRATMTFLTSGEGADGWHREFVKAAMDFKEQGFTEDEASQRLALASPAFVLDSTDLQQLADVYRNRGGALEMRLAWPEMLPATDTRPSRPEPTSVANQRYLLTKILGYSFQVNKRRELIYYGERGSDKKALMSDMMFACLNTEARSYKLSAGESIRDLVTKMAAENAFDPILDQVDRLQWDGESHISQLFSTITLASDTTDHARKWYALYLRRWLIGMVGKILRPGLQNNVLVFQGEQAAGKSRWLKRLAEIWPEGFGEGSVSPENKDHELRHLDNFLWHVSEFDSTTSRREVGALKDYFTKDTVNVRRPYSRLATVGGSICSFCASVNSFDFLHDLTGNRRYLVIPITALNPEHNVNIMQVLAEAKAAFEAGERFFFDKDEIKQINALNETFISKEEFIEAVDENVKPGVDVMPLSQILNRLGYDDLQITKAVRSNLRTIMVRNGVQLKAVGKSNLFMVDGAALKSKRPGLRVLPEVGSKRETAI